jgi:hypothetical protein
MNDIKQISVVGVGRLGLCLALNLERSGYHVIGVDKNLPYISSLNNKTFTSSEPSVDRFLQESKNFKVYSDLKECLASDVSDDVNVLLLREEIYGRFLSTPITWYPLRSKLSARHNPKRPTPTTEICFISFIICLV